MTIEPRMIGMDEAVDLIAGLSTVQGGTTRDRVTRSLIVDLAYTVRVLRSREEYEACPHCNADPAQPNPRSLTTPARRSSM